MKPPVVTWFKVYAAVLALLYMAVIGGGVFLCFFEFPEMSEEDKMMKQIFGPMYAIVGLILLVAFLIGIFAKPKPWVWVYNIVLICLGMTSGCFLPVCIPLLIFYFKPECKLYYGKSA